MISTRSDRRGFALAATLFLLFVVSGFLLEGAVEARVQRKQMLRAADEVRACAAASAGIADAVARLDALQRRSRLLGFGGDSLGTWNHLSESTDLLDLRDVSLGSGESYGVAVRDVGEMLPMNEATEDELVRLFDAVGVDPVSASTIARIIVELRGTPALGTADSTTGHFASPEELRGVPGIRESDLARIRDYLTGFDGGHVNLNTAPEPVLRSLPGMSDDAVGWILRHRELRHQIHSLQEMEARLDPGGHKTMMREFARLDQLAIFAPEAVEITSVGTVDDGGAIWRITAIAARTPSGLQIVQEQP